MKVRDLTHAPVVGEPIYIGTWHLGVSRYLPEPLVTDPSGLISIEGDVAGTVAPDSITISSEFDSCAEFEHRSITAVLLRGRELVPIGFALKRRTVARIAVGQYCGLGAPGEFDEFLVLLKIESVTDSVHGRWIIHYNATRRSDDGPLSGTVAGDSLILDLLPDHDDSACDPHYRLSAPVFDTRVGTAALKTVGHCFASSDRFQLIVDEQTHRWPRPR